MEVFEAYMLTSGQAGCFGGNIGRLSGRKTGVLSSEPASVVFLPAWSQTEAVSLLSISRKLQNSDLLNQIIGVRGRAFLNTCASYNGDE